MAGFSIPPLGRWISKMRDFPFHLRSRRLQSEHGQPSQARRGYLLCELLPARVLCDAFFDSAAPFCVVPYTLARTLPWQQVATRLAHAGKPAPSALLWQGIPCLLGRVTACLV